MRPEVLEFAVGVARLGRDYLSTKARSDGGLTAEDIDDAAAFWARLAPTEFAGLIAATMDDPGTQRKAAEPGPDYRWEARSRRFRDAFTGRFVSRPVVRSALDATLDRASAEARGLAESFAAGKINASEFAIRLRKLTKDAVVASAAVGAGGRAQLTPQQLGAIGSRVKAQYAYIADLMRLVDGGLPLDGKFLARVSMYPLAGTAAYEAILRAGDIESGIGWERRRLGSERPCNGCRAEARRGWQPAGVLKEIGECECLTRCRCSWVRSRNKPTSAKSARPHPHPKPKPHGPSGEGPHHGHPAGTGGQFAPGGGRIPGKGPQVDHDLMERRVAEAHAAHRENNPKGNYEYRYDHGGPKTPADRKHLARAEAGGKVAVHVATHAAHHQGDAAAVGPHMNEGEPALPDRPGAVHHVIGGELVASRYREGEHHVVVDHMGTEWDESFARSSQVDYTYRHKDPRKAERRLAGILKERSEPYRTSARLATHDPHSPRLMDEHGDYSPHMVTTFRVIHHPEADGKANRSARPSPIKADPGDHFDPDQPRSPDGRWGAGGAATPGPAKPHEPAFVPGALGQNVGEATRAIRSRGLAVDPLGASKIADGASAWSAAKVPAKYDAASDKILLNGKAKFWDDPAGDMEKYGRWGDTSTNKATYPLDFATGEALYRRKVGLGEYMAASQVQVPREVTAAIGKGSPPLRGTNLQFVAEVYAGKSAGVAFPSAVLDHYAKLKGPEPSEAAALARVTADPGAAPKPYTPNAAWKTPTPYVPGDRAGNARAAAEAAKARGLDVAADGHAAIVGYVGESRARGIPAANEEARDRIAINQGHEHWDDPAKSSARDHAHGYLSSGDADHVLNHECAHSAHRRDLGLAEFSRVGLAKLSDGERAVANSQVSRYAASGNGGEFVAEVYAGHVAGKRYGPDVLKAYARYKGPKLP